jgi:hypothetical protein
LCPALGPATGTSACPTAHEITPLWASQYSAPATLCKPRLRLPCPTTCASLWVRTGVLPQSCLSLSACAFGRSAGSTRQRNSSLSPPLPTVDAPANPGALLSHYSHPVLMNNAYSHVLPELSFPLVGCVVAPKLLHTSDIPFFASSASLYALCIRPDSDVQSKRLRPINTDCRKLRIPSSAASVLSFPLCYCTPLSTDSPHSNPGHGSRNYNRLPRSYLPGFVGD